jgi:hypothetical protein
VTLYTFTTEEKLAEVERQIEALRRLAATEDNYRQIRIVRSIAADLRGRLGGAPSIALAELERRIVFAHRSKTRLGYDRGALVGIAEELIGRWPTVKQALERFGGES